MLSCMTNSTWLPLSCIIIFSFHFHFFPPLSLYFLISDCSFQHKNCAWKMKCRCRRWTLIIYRAANAAGEWKLNIGFKLLQEMAESQPCVAWLVWSVCVHILGKTLTHTAGTVIITAQNYQRLSSVRWLTQMHIFIWKAFECMLLHRRFLCFLIAVLQQ